jgi:hypothetical protein
LLLCPFAFQSPIPICGASEVLAAFFGKQMDGIEGDIGQDTQCSRYNIEWKEGEDDK